MDLGRRSPVGDAQCREGDGQVEAAWTGAAGIEIEDPLKLLDRWLVRVAIDDRAYGGGLRAEVEILARVDHVDQAASQLDGLGGGQERAGTVRVDVAPNGGDWRDAGELVEDGGVAYIACVEDVVDSSEGEENLRPEQAVRVGYYADEHLQPLSQTRARVQVIAETVADEVEGEDAEGERDGREEHQVR